MSPRFDDEPTYDSTTQVDIEYIRRMYERVIDWYKVSEAKAQLILAVNGVFVTIVAGALFGKIEEVRSLVETFGVDTWVFLLVSLGALVSAVVCATRCLWSRHGRNVRRDFARLGVNPSVPATYRPEALWYFGHLAKLPVESAVQALRQADRKYEIDALTYNVVGLARIVFSKHRFVNAGWGFTALALIALTATGISLVIRSQV